MRASTRYNGWRQGRRGSWVAHGARLREERGGVTLLELLVVMTILVILAAIAIPVYLNQRGKAADRATEAQMRDIGRSAMEGMMFAADADQVGESVDDAIGMNMPVITLNYAPGATSSGKDQVVASLEVAEQDTAWSGAAQPRSGRCTTITVSKQLGMSVPVTRDATEDDPCQASAEVILALSQANFYACRYNPAVSGTDFPGSDGNNASSCPNSLTWNGGTVRLNGAGMVLSKPYQSGNPDTVKYTDGTYTANIVTSGIATAQYVRGAGVVFRASQGPQGMNGMVFQLDQTYHGTGPGVPPVFVMRTWRNGSEGLSQIKPVPPGFAIDGAHQVKVTVQGNTYTAFVNGTQIMTGTIPADIPAGTQFGVRKWGGNDFTVQANGLTLEPAK